MLPEKLVIAENDATPPLRICLASKPAASDIISRKIGGADWEVGVMTVEPRSRVAFDRFVPLTVTLCPPAVGPLEGTRFVMVGAAVLVTSISWLWLARALVMMVTR